MPKATAANVINLGFASEQFGDPTGFEDEDTGYVALILADVALEVEAEVGSTAYTDADAGGTAAQKLAFKRLKHAEMYLTAAQLWRRIEQYERQSKVQGREGSGAETISSRMLNNASEYEAMAWDELALITGTRRSGSSSFGTVETGHFPEAIT
ncbi:MAG: hypothetical protein SV201_14900 [Pseudomonadota bacterium]|nr:hypothetical protein [Pseudomonadota bacterium]